MDQDSVIAAVRRALDATPDDITLRLHLAALLLDLGETAEAIAQAGEALRRDPGNPDARRMMSTALSAADPAEERPMHPAPTHSPEQFDWSKAERQLGEVVNTTVARPHDPDPTGVERPVVTLADVGGMPSVKARLDAAFLAPLRNPELRELYGMTLGGGLLLHGPPGCGKTFIARALAGELGAAFLSASVSDILSPFVGESEANIHQLFQQARREAPCVLFFDEFDALGQRRSQTRQAALRGVSNQLLTELDGVDANNDGVYVLAATNQLWDVDPALRRPGRLDRTVLVLPPDEEARAAIFTTHLKNRPADGIDIAALARATAGYSGADIAHVCASAAEFALLESASTGVARRITMADLQRARADIRPSTGSWLNSARNMVEFGEDDGTFAELRAFLKTSKRL